MGDKMSLSKQDRRDFLGVLGFGAVASQFSLHSHLFGALPVFAAPSNDRPWNVVLILVDDMGWRDLSCYGSEFYQTPNIDRLAAQGARFTDAYAGAPVCSPTRASLLTGQHPARLHLTDWIPGRAPWPTARMLPARMEQQLALERKTLAEALAESGYISASIGKWHLGGPQHYPESQGFALNVAGNHRGSPSSYFGPFDLPGLKGGTSDDYLTEKLTEEAERFIEANREKPFFLYLTEFAVHQPIQARQPVIDKYQARLRPDDPQQHPAYAAMVESVDVAVGRVVQKLEEVGIADRTVVILTSDNGGLIYEGRSKRAVTSNLPLRAGKGHLYEGGIRVPLIIKWPGVTGGKACPVPVCSMDLFPSVLQMIGRPASEGLDGQSLASLLKGSQRLERQALYWHYPHYSNQGGVPSGAIRQGDFKLIEFYEDGRLELFNLREDLGETRNLAKANPDKAKELQQMLERWRRSVNATMPESNPGYDPAKSGQGLTGAQSPTH
ncbi:MAG: DUF4976 domain-containing protein [Acidobacteria bacterium]|nr:MAG: DUF4976 domain-containing protein [Acidobacteriota bacterium]